MFIKKYLKWISTALVLTGILLTNLNIYPINIYFHGLGVVGWTIAGFISKDKAIYSYVDQMIKFYLNEEPKLKQVQTFLCRKKIHKDHVIENISKLVVKPTNGSGGNGILIGPKASKNERDTMIDKIKSKPEDYIAQPLEILSTTPTISDEGIQPRHLDLRPFVLTGKKSWVTTGGLTRVALKKGSTIVNSSQGGGSKDTLVIEK